MKQLNISTDDKLFNRWKSVATEQNTDLVPLIRSMLQRLAPEAEPITVMSSDKSTTISGNAEILCHRGSEGCDFWFGTIRLSEKATKVNDWLRQLKQEWRLTRQNGQFGYVMVFHVAIKPVADSCNIVLGFSGVSKLQEPE